MDQNADYLKNELRVPTSYTPAHDGCLWCTMSIGVLYAPRMTVLLCNGLYKL